MYTLSAEHFIAWSHIYPGFMGKLSTLIHLPLEQICEDYSFFDQAVEDFEHGLDSIFTNSIDIPELNASLNDTDAVPFSVSSGFLCTVSTVSNTFRPQLAPSNKSFKL